MIRNSPSDMPRMGPAAASRQRFARPSRQNRQAPLWVRQQGLLFLALMAAYLTNAMFHDVSRMPAVNMLLYFVAGVTAGLAGRKAEFGTRQWECGERRSLGGGEKREVGGQRSEVETGQEQAEGVGAT